MSVEPQAAMEIVRFIASGPSPEQIIAFHPSPEASARAYALIASERSGSITEDERSEIESCVYLEHMMRLIKAEAHVFLQRRAS